MKRWPFLLLLSFAVSGCALFDDLDFGSDPVAYHSAPNSCGAPVVVNTNQTQEPELMTARK
jgi:hypothetical protein